MQHALAYLSKEDSLFWFAYYTYKYLLGIQIHIFLRYNKISDYSREFVGLHKYYNAWFSFSEKIIVVLNV